MSLNIRDHARGWIGTRKRAIGLDGPRVREESPPDYVTLSTDRQIYRAHVCYRPIEVHPETFWVHIFILYPYLPADLYEVIEI